jgi:hypothetical protein
MTKPKHPNQKEKIAQYEHLLHNIQLHAEVTMNEAAVRELIARICRWSYAHRCGNGELLDSEQQAHIDTAFWKLNPHLKEVPTR